jgi:hypothetical protein
LKERFEQRRLISDYCLKAAIKLLTEGRRRASFKFIWKSIINNPFNYYAWVFLIENFINKDLVGILRGIKRGLVGPKFL